MDLDIKVVLNMAEKILLLMTAVFVIPAVPAFFFSEFRCAGAFTICAVICFGLHFLIKKSPFTSDERLSTRESFSVVTLSWLLLSLLGSVPFMLSGTLTFFPDALFESCSGLSTTGATVIDDLDSIPRSILLWRSFLSWIGGLGILTTAIIIFPNILRRNSTGGSVDKTISAEKNVSPWKSAFAIRLYSLYVLLTIVLFILLLPSKMGVMDSLIYSMGVISTGGFTSSESGIACFNSLYIEIVMMVFMFIASTSFSLKLAVLRDGITRFFLDGELRVYTLLLAGGGGLVGLVVYFGGHASTLPSAFRQGFFQTVSILSTTGYTTADYSKWFGFAAFVFFTFFFIGGCTASTAGGIKCMRIIILLKLTKRTISSSLNPNSVMDIKIEGRKVPSSTVSNVVNFFFLYLIVMIIGGLLISLEEADLNTVLSTVISCMSNIGPGFGMTSPGFTYSFFSGFSKIVLSFLMLAGRLELYAMIMLFVPRYLTPSRYW